MLYIILGTKGQFLKIFPLLKELDARKIPYTFVHTGQHLEYIKNNCVNLNVRTPDVYLTNKKKDLANFSEFLRWAPNVLWNARKLTIRSKDFILIHGDTESALLALIIGKYFRAKVIHVEAGLRSSNLFNPFPEEIIRRIVSWFADICFCPTKDNADNIPAGKEIYITDGNTVFDSVKNVLTHKPSADIERLLNQKYILFLVHRKENLWSFQKKQIILSILEKILRSNNQVVWILHENSKYEFKKQDLWKTIMYFSKLYNLRLIHSFMDYSDFMHLVKHSMYVVSDGGGLQEETFVLDKPLLILRTVTEREWGIGETAYLSGFDPHRVDYFLTHYSQFKRKRAMTHEPTKKIVQTLISKIL